MMRGGPAAVRGVVGGPGRLPDRRLLVTVGELAFAALTAVLLINSLPGLARLRQLRLWPDWARPSTGSSGRR
jgi:hypothetical protein